MVRDSPSDHGQGSTAYSNASSNVLDNGIEAPQPFNRCDRTYQMDETQHSRFADLEASVQTRSAPRQRAGTYPDGCRMKFTPLSNDT
jgi:hypothetical protein